MYIIIKGISIYCFLDSVMVSISNEPCDYNSIKLLYFAFACSWFFVFSNVYGHDS